MLEIDNFATELAIADGFGRYVWAERLPYAPYLLGVRVRLQAGALDPAANPAGLVVSNRAVFAVGNVY